MKKLTVILLFPMVLVACSGKKTLSVPHYEHEDANIEIKHDGQMGVDFDFKKLGFGGQAHQEHVTDNIFSLTVDDKGKTYYLIEDRGMLIVIDSNYELDDIKNSDYVPTFLLYEIVE